MPVRNTPSRGLVLVLVTVGVVLAATACGTARAPVSGAQAVAGLTIDDAALRQWRFLYERVVGVEWMTCLYGRVEGRAVHVERSELADVAMESYAAVSGSCAERAGTRLVGLAHSHPRLPDGRPSCMPSGTDTRDLGRPWSIIVVVCDTGADAVTVGYRVQGRHTVVKTLAVPAVLPPLVLGDTPREPGGR